MDLSIITVVCFGIALVCLLFIGGIKLYVDKQGNSTDVWKMYPNAKCAFIKENSPSLH
jgi:hypothetical protein